MGRAAWWAVLLGLAVGLVGAVGSRADDWPQFRRDPEHSGASRDSLHLPLTELWSWTQQVGRPPVFHASVWHGRVYYLTREGGVRFTRYLVCADARTGAVLWRRELRAAQLSSLMSDSVGPAVSQDGLVFVYDQVPLMQIVGYAADGDYGVHHSNDAPPTKTTPNYSRPITDWQYDPWLFELLTALLAIADYDLGFGGPPDPSLKTIFQRLKRQSTPNGGVVYSAGYSYRRSAIVRNNDGKPDVQDRRASANVSINLAPRPTFCVRTFNGVTGEAGPWVPLGHNGVRWSSALRLQHPPLGVEPVLAPEIQSSSSIGPWEALGPPLIANRSLVATTEGDSLLRWKPFPRLDEGPLFQVHLVHPLVAGAAPPTVLNGIPPTALSTGYLLETDAFNRFIGTVDPASLLGTTHLDLVNSVGVPAVQRGRYYIGLGGQAATRGIAAAEGIPGKPIWTYAPNGLPVDRPNVSQRAVPGRQPASYWLNPGVVVAHGRVYGEVEGEIVALDRDTGELRWRYPLRGAVARSIVAAADHLFLCTSNTRGARQPLWDGVGASDNALVALDLEDGKLEWEQKVSRPGNLSVAEGLLFFTDGGLHVYGAAERVFRLAAETPHPEDYRIAGAAPEREEAPAAAGDTPSVPKTPPAGEAPAPPKRPRTVADATFLRLQPGPADRLVTRVRERRRKLPNVPLVLSLDPLNSSRAAWEEDGSDHPALSQAWIAQYARLCGEVAVAGQPEHFEVLADVNVYLTRFPEHAGDIRSLLAAVVREVRTGSPGTRVCASVNQEVLVGQYGRGSFIPFGKLPADRRVLLPDLLAVLAPVDEIGLTSYPQAAYSQASLMPPDYLQGTSRALGGKPILITTVGVRLDERVSVAELEQERFLRLFMRSACWLDAPVIAYPQLVREREAAGGEGSQALRIGDTARKALDVWQGMLFWKRVEKLTLPKTSNQDEAAGTKPDGG